MTAHTARERNRSFPSARKAGTVRVQCQADNPNPRLQGSKCGKVLGDIPSHYRLVGLAARRPTRPDGRIRIQCARGDCLTWNIFDLP